MVLVDTIAEENDANIVVVTDADDACPPQKSVGIAVLILLIILCSFAEIAIIHTRKESKKPFNGIRRRDGFL